MLTLRTSPASPFGRKVRIAAALVGIEGRIAIVPADTGNPADSLRTQNPLGKIPALIAEDGEAIFDSRVIVEYLDGLAGGGRLIPTDLAARIPALTLQALADGVADAAVLQVYERRMREPAERSAKWVEHQAGKVTRALAALEAKPPTAGATHVGAIALACALGYLDLRFDGEWRAGRPRLVSWLDAFAAAVPAYAATAFFELATRHRREKGPAGFPAGPLPIARSNRSELVVQAGAHERQIEVALGDIHAVRERLAAEGRVDIFGLRRDVVGEGVFDAAAERAAVAPIGRGEDARHVGADVRPGGSPPSRTAARGPTRCPPARGRWPASRPCWCRGRGC